MEGEVRNTLPKKERLCGKTAIKTLLDEGKNPFTLDSKEPVGDYKSFLLGETRYASRMKARPELAEQLFEKTEADSKARLESYKRLSDK